MTTGLTTSAKRYYAIGDVHGMSDMLKKLHEVIMEDIVEDPALQTTIVHLGDYVDRGPDSKGVIDRIRSLEANLNTPGSDLRAVSLLGNHEQMMLDAIIGGHRDEVSHWMINGGSQTVDSFGVMTQFQIPKDVVRWLQALPFFYKDEENKLLFVHAGIEPYNWPEIDKSTAIWTRSQRFFDTNQWPDDLEEWTVVHGHTPGPPEVLKNRINVDTGAVFNGEGYGLLTAVRIDLPSRAYKLFHVNKELEVFK